MNYQDASAQFGTVTFDGDEYALTQQAYIDNCGSGVRYYATAIDLRGNYYRVAWDTTQAWDDAQEEYREREEPHLLSLLEDESQACDWDCPVEVKPI